MFRYLHLQKSHSYKSFLSLIFVIISSSILVSLLLDKNLHHFGKSLVLFFALIVNFAGVIFFLKSNFRYSCICAFFSNIIFAILLLWLNKTYGSGIELTLLLSIIALCSLLFALSLGGTLLIIQSMSFFYFVLFYALLNSADTYLCFVILLALGFYLAFKFNKSWIKIFNFLNLFYFFSLLLIFKEFLWLIPLWIVFVSITLTHTSQLLSTPTTDKLSLLSLILLISFLQNSDIFVSNVLQGSWIWIFILVTLSFWLWIQSKWFISIFIFLLVCTPIIEDFLFQNEFFYLYYWFLFFLVWFQLILRWAVFGFCLLCLFVLFEYLLGIESYSNLGLFFILCCIVFFTLIIMRSENAG